jgi:hypothetical protein
MRRTGVPGVTQQAFTLGASFTAADGLIDSPGSVGASEKRTMQGQALG